MGPDEQKRMPPPPPANRPMESGEDIPWVEAIASVDPGDDVYDW